MLFNGKYEKIERLKSGGYGTIYKVQEKKNKKKYALKCMGNKPDFEKEIEVMKNIKNKYIIELKDNFYDKIEQF